MRGVRRHQGHSGGAHQRVHVDKYRIITTPITVPKYNGIRVTPNIYTPLEEIDTFVAAMEDLLRNGVPATA